MTKMAKKTEQTDSGNPTLRIVPISAEKGTDEKKKALLELQLTMATSSINHEYARREFDDTDCRETRESLLDYMQDCRIKYFEARESLERFDPGALMDFERDLLKQKVETMSEYNA
jgi:hypothetical protein